MKNAQLDALQFLMEDVVRYHPDPARARKAQAHCDALEALGAQDDADESDITDALAPVPPSPHAVRASFGIK